MEKQIEVARKAALAFAKKHPYLEKDELVAESYVIMVDAISSWDAGKGRALNSWVAFVVHRELKKKYVSNSSTPNTCEYNDELSESTVYEPERIIAFWSDIADLSTTGQEVVELLLRTPEALELSETHGKNAVKSHIKKVLRKRKTPWNKIQLAFKELRALANSF